jgi:hypothetical protein
MRTNKNLTTQYCCTIVVKKCYVCSIALYIYIYIYIYILIDTIRFEFIMFVTNDSLLSVNQDTN